MSGVMQNMVRDAINGPASQPTQNPQQPAGTQQPGGRTTWQDYAPPVNPSINTTPTDDRFGLRPGDTGFTPPPAESIQGSAGGGKGKGNQTPASSGFYLPFSGQYINTGSRPVYTPGMGNNGSPVSGSSPLGGNGLVSVIGRLLMGQ